MSHLPMMEVELYDFNSASGQFRLTPHEFDVNLNGTLYKSLTIERSELVMGAEAAKSALELKMPPDSDIVRHLLAISLIGEIASITLRTGRRLVQTEYWQMSNIRWMGRVLGVEVSDDVARVRCESAQVSLKRIGLRRLYSRKCSHVLYSTACGATRISASASVTSINGRNVGLSGGVPASVSGMLAGGSLEKASGSRYMVTREIQNVGVEVLTVPIGLSVGDTVTLVAGCDHLAATCAARFNNLDNFGGFPFIPSKNPFSTGVF